MDRIVTVAASAGGLLPIRQIVSALPADCRASLFIVQHIGANPSRLPDILSMDTRLPVSFARDHQEIEHGQIYVAPPDHHLRLSLSLTHLDRGPKMHFTRPAADPLFISAADTYGPRVIGIVLSGRDGDGAAGVRAIKARGGLAWVQEPSEASEPSMPLSALKEVNPDARLSVSQMAERIAELCSPPRRDPNFQTGVRGP